MSENEKNEQNEYAPLKGIKIVDWTQVQSGPSCTQLLAWLGADVIKIERTNTGDPTRNELLDIKDSWSLYYLQLNANKRSLTLDIKTPEGKKIMYDLAKKLMSLLKILHQVQLIVTSLVGKSFTPSILD